MAGKVRFGLKRVYLLVLALLIVALVTGVILTIPHSQIGTEETDLTKTDWHTEMRKLDNLARGSNAIMIATKLKTQFGTFGSGLLTGRVQYDTYRLERMLKGSDDWIESEFYNIRNLVRESNATLDHTHDVPWTEAIDGRRYLLFASGIENNLYKTPQLYSNLTVLLEDDGSMGPTALDGYFPFLNDVSFQSDPVSAVLESDGTYMASMNPHHRVEADPSNIPSMIEAADMIVRVRLTKPEHFFSIAYDYKVRVLGKPYKDETDLKVPEEIMVTGYQTGWDDSSEWPPDKIGECLLFLYDDGDFLQVVESQSPDSIILKSDTERWDEAMALLDP